MNRRRPAERNPDGDDRAESTNAVLGRLRAYWRDHENLRFLAVGGWNTLFGYLCFVTLYLLLASRLHYLLIGLLAHVIAAVNAFVAYRVLVFASRGPWIAEFLRFNLTLGFVLGYGIVGLWLLVETLHLDPILAQALVTVSAVVVSYFAHRHFTFGESSIRKNGSRDA